MLANEYYQSNLKDAAKVTTRLQQQTNNFSRFRLWAALAILAALYYVITKNNDLSWVFLIGSITAFFIFVNRHNIFKEQLRVQAKHTELLQAELTALQGDISAFDSGQQYVDPTHAFTYDLDVFGKGSVYQLLCRAVTTHGKIWLAGLLKHPYSDTTTLLDRQTRIKELSTMPDFLQSFKLRGSLHEEGKNDREKILRWVTMPLKFNNKLLKFASVAMPVLSAAVIALSIYQQSIHPLLSVIIGTNWVVLIIYNKGIKETHHLVGYSVKSIDKYEQLLQIVATQRFDAASLQTVQNACSSSATAVTGFKKLVHLFDSRQNGMVGPLMNTFFLFDIYCVLKLEQWKQKNQSVLLKAFDHIDEMDAFVSLANYAFNYTTNVYPTFNTDSVFGGIELKHPLILSDTVVGNDVSLNATERLYLLTGANMTGKSTYIRTVGITIILSYAGLPVRAQSANIPLANLFTSMRITDSVQEDVSYFKAELNRMQRIMLETSRGIPYIVLIDEPLRGTNSEDKQNGTIAIIAKLLKTNTMGIVATHDTGLCKLETKHAPNVVNHHFDSTVSDGQLLFDYTIKKGCSTSNNATMLMQLMGIV